MNDNTKKFMNISIRLTVILLLVRCLISWTDVKTMWEAGQVINLSYCFFGFIGEAIGVAAILMTAFNKWAWKWKCLRWTLKTDESSSRSLTASFSEVQSVQYLIYTYQNDPRAEIQDRSPMHYGTAMLNVSNPMILEGNYFTGRKSRGSMKFEAVK